MNSGEPFTELIFRKGTAADAEQLRLLALAAWSGFQRDLTPDNWNKLFASLDSRETFVALLQKAHCVVCQEGSGTIVGMAFLVPSGNPTDIYAADWAYIRFVSVHPDYSGRGIGRQLTERCIEIAKRNGEHTIALHTSEMMQGARKIYERLGFVVLRELEPRLGKRYWLYTLPISY